ncbi:MAG: alanine--tRNA ligase [Syntrophales bacterium]|nr:alanine--tRNA ligase [Syntrophales bacterium]MDY0043567.1 alanine--tRNA ligase [Syntrophales bacterium]
MITGNEVRSKFLSFFSERGHAIVESSGLIPKEDPTLLFTNAGMVQFKNLFLGQEKRGYTRAATSQKCVRAGGKHNDLETVGYSARHHTFFEMLGNFSFGDYFKKEAIAWGWEFLTGVMGLPGDRLWITIYKDDDEAFEIWHTMMGIPKERIVRLGEKDNFWMMGDTGPCGPCSEILLDQGEEIGCGRPECSVECECGRYVELWNLVFTQFDRDASGTLTPLPKPNIDTGMGLERLTAVLQGVTSNYDSDLFSEIIAHIGEVSGKRYKAKQEDDISIRVIADHARAVTFLIADGVLPGNEGRGYVLRRILRRAARHGKLLGLDKPFLHDMVPVVIEKMKGVYPELLDKESYVRKVVVNEEQRFMETLDAGLKILNEQIASLVKDGKSEIPGMVVFRLYDTFGFPVDLTGEAARSKGLSLDMAGFEKAMEEQREKARQSWRGSGEEEVADSYRSLSRSGIKTEFVGYEGNTEATSRVTAILKNDEPVDVLSEGERGEVFVEQTPFYGEVGGQIGDVGVIETGVSLFEVWDTQKPMDELFSHIGKVRKGEIRVGDTADLRTEEGTRRAIEANHSGTHVLQAALKQVLGDHVKQSGSLVNAERLRFDFTHFAKIEDDEMERVEHIANRYIRDNYAVTTDVLPRDEAMKTGATAVFDEKYGDIVRLVRMGDFSAELCGGTHVRRTGDIGFLKVVSETSVAAGVRRLEAVTGGEAVRYAEAVEKELKRSAGMFKTAPLELSERLEKVLANQKELEREIETLKGKLASRDSSDLMQKAKESGGISILAAIVDAPDVKTLRDFGDKVRDRMSSGLLLLGSKVEGKAMLLCMVTKDLTHRFHAGNIIKELAPLVGGKGGGRPDMAQAGGPNPEGLEHVLRRFEEIASN